MSDTASPWAGRRALVTGCTGHLGGAVARALLAAGAEVVGLVHERPALDVFAPGQGGRAHFVRGRADNVFRLHSAMAVHEVSAVFHLVAADALDRTIPAVLEAARLYSRRVPVVAARPLAAPAPPDGLSAARFGAVFGPGDRNLLRPVPATALALHAGDGGPPLGDGPPVDCVYVDDAARACLLVAQDAARRGPCDHAFRTGWELSARRLADALREGFYGLAPRAPEPGPAANPLGWSPAVSFGAAVAETLDGYGGLLRAGCGAPARAAA